MQSQIKIYSEMQIHNSPLVLLDDFQGVSAEYNTLTCNFYNFSSDSKICVQKISLSTFILKICCAENRKRLTPLIRVPDLIQNCKSYFVNIWNMTLCRQAQNVYDYVWTLHSLLSSVFIYPNAHASIWNEL